MTTQPYNLDESLAESFSFTIKGHEYNFRHLNTEEMDELAKLEGQSEKLKEFIIQFISKVDDKSPDFSEILKTMITPQWRNFRKMMKVEFSTE